MSLNIAKLIHQFREGNLLLERVDSLSVPERILVELEGGQAFTRAQLQFQTGIPWSTLWDHLEHLQRQGRVESFEHKRKSRGRRPRYYYHATHEVVSYFDKREGYFQFSSLSASSWQGERVQHRYEALGLLPIITSSAFGKRGESDSAWLPQNEPANPGRISPLPNSRQITG